jgi:hypothetical protein
MSYAYADTTETIADVLTEVTDTEQIETVGRLIQAVSAFIDRFTNRPPGYFLSIGPTAGVKQKINVLVDADGLSQDSQVTLTLTAAGLAGSPLATTIDVVFGVDDSGTIATALNDAVNGVTAITDFLNVDVGDDGISLDIEIKTLAAVDSTFTARVEGVGAGTGVVTTNATVVNAGSYSPATVRRYRGAGKNYLQIGRHVPGSVTVENVATDLFYEHTENGWLFAVDFAGQPGNAGYESDDYSFRYPACSLFTDGALYLVTARWGFVATPDDIDLATKQIVQQVWDRGKGIIGTLSPTGFVVERDIPLTARLMLEGWTRREFELN